LTTAAQRFTSYQAKLTDDVAKNVFTSFYKFSTLVNTSIVAYHAAALETGSDVQLDGPFHKEADPCRSCYVLFKALMVVSRLLLKTVPSINNMFREK